LDPEGVVEVLMGAGPLFAAGDASSAAAAPVPTAVEPLAPVMGKGG